MDMQSDSTEFQIAFQEISIQRRNDTLNLGLDLSEIGLDLVLPRLNALWMGG